MIDISNLAELPISFIEGVTNYTHKNDMNNNSDSLISVGNRNNYYASLAGFLRYKGASESAIKNSLLAIDSTLLNPLGEVEISSISHSISKYSVTPLTSVNHDDISRFMATEHNSKIKYCEQNGFYVYEGNRWVNDFGEIRVTRLIRETIPTIMADLESLRHKMADEDYAKLKKNAAKLKNASFINSIIKLMKSDLQIYLPFEEFNKKRNLINFQNGTFNTETLELEPHKAIDYLTHILDFEYDPQADCPLFKKFLDEILSEEVTDFFLRVLGYCLLGHGREQKIFIFHSRGGQGKSILISMIDKVLGFSTATLQADSFSGHKQGQVRNDLARLPGMRILVINETGHGMIIEAPLFKQIVGLDKMTARFLNKEYFEFRPCCVPFIITNYLPVIDGSDYAMERRLCLISFDKIIQNIDRDIEDKMSSEKAGIFNLIVQGMKDYQARGTLDIPPKIQAETKIYVDRSNLVKGFAQDCLQEHEGSRIEAQRLYDVYTVWCRDNHYRALSANLFKDAFEKETGLHQKRDGKGRYWPNLRRYIAN